MLFLTKHFNVTTKSIENDANKIIFSKRKMDAKFASTEDKLVFSQPMRILPLMGLICQNNFTSSSRKWTIICTSNLQVHLSVLISDRICPTVILTVISEFGQ